MWKVNEKGRYTPPAGLIYIGDNLANVIVHEQRQMCLQMTCDKLKVAGLDWSTKKSELI